MATTQELILKISADGGNLKSTMTEIRSEITKTTQAQTHASQAATTAAKSELSVRQQLAAAASLQRQRSAALFSAWKQEQGATTSLRESIRGLTSSVAALQGPLGPLAGRLSSVGTVATEAGTGIGLLGIGIAGLGAAVAGVIGTLVLAGKAIFDIAQSTAEFGGKLFDLSKQTNFTVETLSALGQAAKTSGGSIDTVSASLGIFQANMLAAQQGQKEMSRLFKSLNIDTNDNEKALRQAFKALAALGETEKQVGEARKLFGRSGREILGIIKETNGNLDEAIARYQKMGLIISTQAAASADKFSDTLSELNDQLAAVGRTIGFAVIPVLTVFFEDMSRGLTGSAGNWATWGEAVQKATAVAVGAIEAFVQFLASKGQLDFIALTRINAQAIFDQARANQAILGVTSVTDQAARLAAGGRGTGTGTGRGGGGKGTKTDELFKAALEASKATTEKELEQQRHLSVQLQATFDESRASLEEFYKGRQTLIDEHFNTLIDQINREQEALDAARQRGLIKKSEADKLEAELTNRTTAAVNKEAEETRRNKLERQKALDAAELSLNKQLAEIREAQREGENQRNEALLERGAINEIEALDRRLAIEKEAQADRVLLIDLELKQLSTSAERKIELDNEKIKSEIQFTDQTKRLTQERIDARNKEAFEAGEPGGFETDPTKRRGNVLSDEDLAALGPPPGIPLHIEALAALRGAYEELAGSIGNAVGNMVENFVLLGNAGPESFRKVFASALAGVAATAAVQAIYELALGIAALTPWGFALYGSPVAHFKSAALLGSIAGVAAIAGRGIAGSAFSTPAASASGGGPRDKGDKSEGPTRIDAARSLAPVIQIIISGEAGEAFNYKVVKAITKDFRNNGDTRALTARV